MLLEGDGVEQNVIEGLKWLRRAARRGDEEAQYNLGSAYLDGEGVKRSILHARTWLSKASKKGHTKARRLLQSLKVDGAA
jgi:TPR repeat protein